MKKRTSSRVSVRDVARAAAISISATYYALQNKPEVSRQTRDRVLRIAEQLGYVPDARMSVVMASVRRSTTKDLLPLGWLNTHAEKGAWHTYKYLSPYLEGAQERGLQLGYRLEEFWLHQPGSTMRRMSQILDQRGIDGVIVTYHTSHFRLNWNRLAAVSIENTTLAPSLHRVTSDFFSNFLLAVKMLKRAGYQGIGACLAETIDRRTRHGISAVIHHPAPIFPKLKFVPPLFLRGEPGVGAQAEKKAVIAWIRRHRPDVIVGHDNRLVQWVEEAGYRVPQDIGVAHLATDDDVSDWAGIFSNRKAIGAAAVEWVISLIQNRAFGVPKPAFNQTVQGTWHSGRTLLIPKST